MKVPNFLPGTKIALPNGDMHPAWYSTFERLFQEMQGNLSDQGIQSPRQPTATINQLTDPDHGGKTYYDTDTNEMKVNINGVIKVFTVT